MYKNIKILKKNENLKNRFSKVSIEKKLEWSKLIPIGIDEVMEYGSVLPIVISRGEHPEFALFAGLSSTNNIFTQSSYMKEPSFLRNYPFMMVYAKNQNDEEMSVIGIDVDEDFVGFDKEVAIFGEDGELTLEAKELMDNVRGLHRRREALREIAKELKRRDLLMEQSFNINVEGTIQNILKDYYIVDIKKLRMVDDETLSLWAKRGWIGIIDTHLYSLRNFEKIVDYID